MRIIFGAGAASLLEATFAAICAAILDTVFDKVLAADFAAAFDSAFDIGLTETAGLTEMAVFAETGFVAGLLTGLATGFVAAVLAVVFAAGFTPGLAVVLATKFAVAGRAPRVVLAPTRRDDFDAGFFTDVRALLSADVVLAVFLTPRETLAGRRAVFVD